MKTKQVKSCKECAFGVNDCEGKQCCMLTGSFAKQRTCGKKVEKKTARVIE